MSQVRVKLADGSERIGRWVTLDEWMAPLDKDHPARKELFALRMNLGSAMAQIDKLERLNASLHQQFIEEMAKQEQPKANELHLEEPRGMATGKPGGSELSTKPNHERPNSLDRRKVPRRRPVQAPDDGGNPEPEANPADGPVD